MKKLCSIILSSALLIQLPGLGFYQAWAEMGAQGARPIKSAPAVQPSLLLGAASNIPVSYQIVPVYLKLPGERAKIYEIPIFQPGASQPQKSDAGAIQQVQDLSQTVSQIPTDKRQSPEIIQADLNAAWKEITSHNTASGANLTSIQAKSADKPTGVANLTANTEDRKLTQEPKKTTKATQDIGLKGRNTVSGTVFLGEKATAPQSIVVVRVPEPRRLETEEPSEKKPTASYWRWGGRIFRWASSALLVSLMAFMPLPSLAEPLEFNRETLTLSDGTPLPGFEGPHKGNQEEVHPNFINHFPMPGYRAYQPPLQNTGKLDLSPLGQENDIRPLGGPLESAAKPGLWLGKGDNESGNSIQGTALMNGKELSYANMRFWLRDQFFTQGKAMALFRIVYDPAPGMKRQSADLGLVGRTHGLIFRVLQQQRGAQHYTLYRGSYVNRLKIGGFTNQLTLKSGVKTHETRIGRWSKSWESQYLFGVANTLAYAVTLKELELIAELGGETLQTRMYDQYQWDHHKLHGGLQATWRLHDNLHVIGNYKYRYLRFNELSHFFADKPITDDQMLVGFRYDNQMKGNERLAAEIITGAHYITGAEADDRIQRVGGSLTALKTTLTAIAENGDWRNSYTLGLARQLAKNLIGEITYNINEAKDGSYKERLIGAVIRIGLFGNGIDDRRYKRTGDDIYGEHYYQDRGVSFDQSTRQMDSFRKIGETAYYMGSAPAPFDKWADYPQDTYNARAGDPFARVWLDAWRLNHNSRFTDQGNEAHILNYFNSTGGAYSVLLGKQKNKVILNDNGLNYKIDVDPNAPLEDRTLAALRQTAPYLGMPIGNEPVAMGLYGPEVRFNWVPFFGYDFTYLTDPKISPIILNELGSTAKRPTFETGVGATIGLDGWDEQE